MYNNNNEAKQHRLSLVFGFLWFMLNAKPFWFLAPCIVFILTSWSVTFGECAWWKFTFSRTIFLQRMNLHKRNFAVQARHGPVFGAEPSRHLVKFIATPLRPCIDASRMVAWRESAFVCVEVFPLKILVKQT